VHSLTHCAVPLAHQSEVETGLDQRPNSVGTPIDPSERSVAVGCAPR
jgi:hypothetical protein